MAAAVFRAGLAALFGAACTSVALDARSFDGTRWHVTAINGRATPAGGDYTLSFRRGDIGGRFGCNSFGGPYRVRGETLTAGTILATQMGCPDPAGRFERDGFAVLRKPMRWTAARKLTLSNHIGAIALERRR